MAVVGAPSGTVTFLFTDIEGSTRRWQDEPEAMRALLVEHDAILRDAIDKHRGHLFKHTGDGVAAVFASTSDAVSAAVDAQERLNGVLPVRMGLHTGEAEVRDGDFFGSTLNRCARLMGVAHGGQVVCSAATIELVRDRDDLRDLGEHRLRDLSRAEHVWQIGGTEFPSLRSLDSGRTNLPLQLTSFVGREQEMAELAAALKEQRLVTVTGVGGVGKTRLALQVGASLLPRFVDGVWLVELAPIADSDASLHALANIFLIARRQGMSMLESVVDFFKLREVLLVLDNCEHVLGASAELVSSILRGCPGVRFLVTSREALGVAGEQIWSLRSLSLPSAGGPIGDTESVRLFVERARVARAGFTPSPETEHAIAEICRRLDGIPLAIELAAARVSSLGPADIARRLTERFRLLTGGRRAALERHQTLRATVDWSYELLDGRARAVFARVSVFAGSFTPDAAEAVASGVDIDEFGVLDVVDDLVKKSMVVADERDGSVRYRMLETLRQYAQERLDASDEADRYRLRHAEWCVSFAEGAEEARRTADTSFVLLEEIDNLRAGYRWAFDAQRFDLAIG